MPTIKLTQAAVERLKPPATGRVEYWDSQLPGFGLRIAAARPGRAGKDARRTWQAFYRVKGQGTVVRETIGTSYISPPSWTCIRAKSSAGRCERPCTPRSPWSR